MIYFEVKYIRLDLILYAHFDFQHISARAHPPKRRSRLGARPVGEIVARFGVKYAYPLDILPIVLTGALRLASPPDG